MKKNLYAVLFFLFCQLLHAQAQFLLTTDAVRLQENNPAAGANMYVLENGLMGLIIPKASAYSSSNPTSAPAPVQSIIYYDNVVSDHSANYINCGAQNITGMTVQVVLQTTEECIVQYQYKIMIGSAEKYYKSTISLKRGAKSAMIEEEATADVCWDVKFSDGLQPTEARYRGWGNYIAGNPGDIQNGYEWLPDNSGNIIKQAYRTWGQPGRGDALLDLHFNNPRSYPLQLWECGGNAAMGWYYQFYNNNPGISNNRLFGVFHGRPSKLLMASPNSHTNFTSVHIITGPGGIKYLKGDKDDNNHLHYAWVTMDNELNYIETDQYGHPLSPAVSIGSGLTNPGIYLKNNQPVITATSVSGDIGGTVVQFKRINNQFTPGETLSFDKPTPIMDAGYTKIALGAANDQYDFLLVSGGLVSGVRKYYLYYRNLYATGNFILSDSIKVMEFFRQRYIPDMRITPNGKVQVMYTDGFNAAIAVIQPSSFTFNIKELVTGAEAWTSPVTDRYTMKSFTDREWNTLAIWQPANGIICKGGVLTNSQGFPHGGDEQNVPATSSIAFEPSSGNALLYLQDKFYKYKLVGGNGVWTELTGTVSSSTHNAAIFFLNGKFHIAGNYNGALRNFEYNINDQDFQVLPDILFAANNNAMVRSQIMMGDDGGNTAVKRRFEWGIFAGNKTDDLQPVQQFQGIGVEMNRQSGLGTKVNNYISSAPMLTPDFDLAAIYSSSADVQNLIRKIETDESFFNKMKNFDMQYSRLFEAWRYPQTIGVSVAESLISEIEAIRNSFINQDGVYDLRYAYVSGAMNFHGLAISAACILADANITLTAAQRDSLKRLVSLCCRVIWDEDHAPVKNWNNSGLQPGVGLSTPNIVSTYLNERSFFAMLLQPDPFFTGKADSVKYEMETILNNDLNDCGSPKTSSHYMQAGYEPTLFTLLQLQRLHPSIDFFDTDYNRLKRYADFLFSISTPPNPRFGGNRKQINVGDGQEESSTVSALLGTGMKSRDAILSKRLMTFFHHGTPRYSRFGPLFLAVDLTGSYNEPPALASSNANGYLSHLRSASNTANETAAWMINGGFYSDHRHDDAGQVVLYGLKTPISINWDGTYNPHKNHAAMKSVVLPNSYFTQWDDVVNGQPVNDVLVTANHTWLVNYTKEFGKFSNTGFATATMRNEAGSLEWERTLRLLSPRPDRPVIVIYDAVKNANTQTISNDNYIWSMPFMTDTIISVKSIGAAQPYEETLIPPGDFWPYPLTSNGPNPRPTVTRTTPGAGLFQFGFIGTNWGVANAAISGIDWKMYSLTNNPVEYNASKWTHNFIEDPEKTEYFSALGRTYKETQEFIRIRNRGEFFTVIVPYNKGTDPYEGKVSNSANGEIKIQFDNADLFIGKEYSLYKEQNKTTYTTFSKTNYANISGDILMSGGAAELVLEANRAIVRIHGNEGQRKITIPRLNYVLSGTDNSVSLEYTSATTTININYGGGGLCVAQDEQGYKEFVFVPAVLKAGYNSPVCTGSQLQLTVSPSLANATYRWTGPNGFTSTLQNPVINNVALTASGMYNCMVTSGGNVFPTLQVQVVIFSTPFAPVLSYNNPVCVNSALSLRASSSSSSTSEETYQWSGPAGFNSIQQYPVINNVSMGNSGVYVCRVTSQGCTSPQGSLNVSILLSGCNSGGGGGSTGRGTITAIKPKMIKENNIEKYETGHGIENITLYPNPTDGKLFIKTSEALYNVKLELFSAAGNRVWSTYLGRITADRGIILPLYLANGTYIMRLMYEGGLMTYKVNLQRK